MIRRVNYSIVLLLILCLGIFHASIENSGPKKVLTFQDIMKFKKILQPKISEDGQWIAYQAQPGRGDKGIVCPHVRDQP